MSWAFAKWRAGPVRGLRRVAELGARTAKGAAGKLQQRRRSMGPIEREEEAADRKRKLLRGTACGGGRRRVSNRAQRSWREMEESRAVGAGSVRPRHSRVASDERWGQIWWWREG